MKGCQPPPQPLPPRGGRALVPPSRAGKGARGSGRPVLLAIDVGNTNIVVGLFRGERLEGNWRLATDAARTTDEYAVLIDGLLGHTGNTFDQVSGVSISSVVPTLTATFRELGERYLDLPALVV